MPSRMRRFRPLVPQMRQLGQVRRKLLSGFYRGYEPDLSHWVTEDSSCDEFHGIVVEGEYLVADEGWRPLDAPHLPLGHDRDAPGYIGAGPVTYGIGVAPADSVGDDDILQPVVGIFRFSRLEASTATVETIAITAYTGTHPAPAANAETSNWFRIGGAVAQWTRIVFDTGDSVGVHTLDTPPLAPANYLPDAAVYSSGSPEIQYTTGAAVLHRIKGIAESIFIVANRYDEILYFPRDTGSNSSTSFFNWYTQLNGLGTAVAGDGGTYLAPTFTRFKAKSCASGFGVMVYLNTVEGTANKYQRARWSVVGSPFNIWPELLIDATAAAGNPKIVLAAGVGAGWHDFDEFTGVGLRVEPIGDTGFACYFEDGVGFLIRGTTITGAFRRRYITHDRGLLSTQALVNLGGGVHFGIFTDGWYLLDEFGKWKEVGRVGDEDPLDVALDRERARQIAYKWKHTFYKKLDPEQRARTITYFNPVNKRVYIEWYGTDGVHLWIYDIQSDRVTTDDWSNVGGDDQTPTAFGDCDKVVDSVVTWTGSAGLTWDQEAGLGSWADLAVSYNQRAMAHGTLDGMVYVHDPQLATRNGTPIPWRLRTKVNTMGEPGRHVLWHRLWVQYVNQESTCAGASLVVDGVGGTGEVVSEGGSVDLTKGTEGSTQSDHLGVRVPGDHHTLTMEGVGAPRIQAVSVEYTTDDPIGMPAIGSEE